METRLSCFRDFRQALSLRIRFDSKDFRLTKPTVGLIGVGEMGQPMGLNLIAAGFSLVVYDVRPEALQEVKKGGARVASSPADVAQLSDVIISILPSSKIVKEVLVRGKDCVLSNIEKRHTVIEMSTLDVDTTLDLERLIRERGAKFIDAPIIGVPEKVKTRDILIVASGYAMIRLVENP